MDRVNDLDCKVIYLRFANFLNVYISKASHFVMTNTFTLGKYCLGDFFRCWATICSVVFATEVTRSRLSCFAPAGSEMPDNSDFETGTTLLWPQADSTKPMKQNKIMSVRMAIN